MLFSFGSRGPNGGYAAGFHARQLREHHPESDPFITSLTLAVIGTLLCLLVASAARVLHRDAWRGSARPAHPPARHPVLDELPHPDVRLAHHPGPGGARRLHRRYSSAIGLPDPRHSAPACCIGLVYGYLPLMVFPLYVTLERMDRTLVEASKDLGAGRWRRSDRSRCRSLCPASSPAASSSSSR